jgi:signal transduction protein with GAF and PtsI domain
MTEAAAFDTNSVLADITSEMVGEFQISVLLDRVVQTAMRTLGADVCSIFLEDPPDSSFVVMKAGSGFARPLVDRARYRIGRAS